MLALLRRRALTGGGGWAETSLYDGMLATLGCMIGRSERAAPEVEGYWETGSTFPNFLYRCADGELLQVWFGGKGMYPKLLEVLGDEPSSEGYYTDQATGALRERAERWRSVVRRPAPRRVDRPRSERRASPPSRCSGPARRWPTPTWPRSAWRSDGPSGATTTSCSPPRSSVVPLADDLAARVAPADAPPTRTGPGSALLAGVKVVDFSAFVAGPLAAEVLADLGAEVIKVEPPGGEAMRGAAYAIAACQRGKRSLAMDIGAADARPVVERLITWADVVLHNFRVGVSERLGIDEASVARLNPDAVYCHASAFGPTGPRAKAPGNDALMQALTGFERAIGGVGNDPIAATWIPIDMVGGWVAATGILAGLYARGDERSRPAGGDEPAGRRDAAAQRRVPAGRPGGARARARRRPDRLRAGLPPLRGRRRRLAGAGAARPRGVGALAPARPRPPRCRPRGHRCGAAPTTRWPARPSQVLEAAFATAGAAEWVARLRDVGLLAERVEAMDRDAFRRGIIDDPVNRQLGRVVEYDTTDWGHFEQIGPLLRCGPSVAGGPALMLPGIGEHSAAVLRDLGFGTEDVDALLAAKVVRQG